MISFPKTCFVALLLCLIVSGSAPHQAFAAGECGPNATQAVKILMLGNSFTYSNDMPGMLRKIAASDSSNNLCFDVTAVTRPGIHLMELWKKTEAYRRLTSESWTYVILQDYSMWPFKKAWAEETQSALNLLAGVARQVQAAPFILETWADDDDSSFYRNRDYPLYGLNFDKAQKTLIEQTAQVARVNDLTVVPIGSVWARAYKTDEAPDLYARDKHHPSAAGTYLAALVLYRTLAGNKPDRVTYSPDEIDKNDAALLRRIAAQ